MKSLDSCISTTTATRPVVEACTAATSLPAPTSVSDLVVVVTAYTDRIDDNDMKLQQRQLNFHHQQQQQQQQQDLLPIATALVVDTQLMTSYTDNNNNIAHNTTNHRNNNNNNNNTMRQSLFSFNNSSRGMLRLLLLMVSVLIVVTIGDLWKSSWIIQQFGTATTDATSASTASSSSGDFQPRLYDTVPPNDHPLQLQLLINNDSTTPPPPPPPNNQRFENNDRSSPIQDSLDDLSMEQYILQTVPLSSKQRGTNPKQLRHWIDNLQFAYHNNVTEMIRDRNDRFPSIQQRVQLYMSDWYIPPCPPNDNNIDTDDSDDNDDDDDTSYVAYQYDSSSSSSSSTKQLLTVREIEQPSSSLPQSQRRRSFVINSHFDGTHDESFDEIHYMDEQLFIHNCTHKYCQDMVEFFIPALHRVIANITVNTNHSHNNNNNNNNNPIVQQQQQQPTFNIPILYQFGDMHQTRGTQYNATKIIKHVRYPNIPVLQKVRVVIPTVPSSSTTTKTCYHPGERHGAVVVSETNNSNLHYEPIIFKLKTHRHYGGIYKVADADIVPWDEKKNMAVFRGALTGLYPNDMKLKEIEGLSVTERCYLLPRCWFTYTHAASKYIDSKLTEPFPENKLIPRSIVTTTSTGEQQQQQQNHNNEQQHQTIELYGNRMQMDELLQYKALILLEGNDVSSGLKWALFSNSIVMMPPPTLTSWAMEELLQPWVHYVPIQIYTNATTSTPTGTHRNVIPTTDAEEKMQWIMDNEEKARAIVRASTLWIADLVLHPNVPDDEIQIFDDIAQRYIAHFLPATTTTTTAV